MSKARQKGTSFESLLVSYLVARGFDAERQVLHGSADQGDIRIRIPGSAGLNIEAKNVRSMSLGAWVEEATAEAANAGRPCVVVHKRHGKGSAADQFVTMKLSQLVDWFLAVDPSLSTPSQ